MEGNWRKNANLAITICEVGYPRGAFWRGEKSTSIFKTEVSSRNEKIFELVKSPTLRSGFLSRKKFVAGDVCKAHENRTLEDWKQVIWTDETPIILGNRREGSIGSGAVLTNARWRHLFVPDGKYASEIMFWVAFLGIRRAISYLESGNCKAEKATQKEVP